MNRFASNFVNAELFTKFVICNLQGEVRMSDYKYVLPLNKLVLKDIFLKLPDDLFDELCKARQFCREETQLIETPAYLRRLSEAQEERQSIATTL